MASVAQPAHDGPAQKSVNQDVCTNGKDGEHSQRFLRPGLVKLNNRGLDRNRSSAFGRFRSVRFPDDPPPSICSIFRRYVLGMPSAHRSKAGPFYVRKRLIELWSICSPSPTEALTHEDHTAPIQTAPLKLHSEGGTLKRTQIRQASAGSLRRRKTPVCRTVVFATGFSTHLTAERQ